MVPFVAMHGRSASSLQTLRYQCSTGRAARFASGSSILDGEKNWLRFFQMKTKIMHFSCMVHAIPSPMLFINQNQRKSVKEVSFFLGYTLIVY